MAGSSFPGFPAWFREEPWRFHVSGFPDSEMLLSDHQADLGLTILFWLL
ncbi:MAG: hypothetical protein H6540_03135 [Bacteroidales bacterium]|nr:hypothetical protein [Bacteroidales bacterium]MCB9013858.1 hypothetical protein [Bacteroidales bacterium]